MIMKSKISHHSNNLFHNQILSIKIKSIKVFNSKTLTHKLIKQDKLAILDSNLLIRLIKYKSQNLMSNKGVIIQKIFLINIVSINNVNKKEKIASLAFKFNVNAIN